MFEKMLERINEFVPIIKVLTDLGKFGISCMKTEQDEFEELNFVMESVLYNNWGNEIYPKDVRKWFASLPKKYDDPKYYNLKGHVYWKMRTEDRLKHKFHIPAPRKEIE